MTTTEHTNSDGVNREPRPIRKGDMVRVVNGHPDIEGKVGRVARTGKNIRPDFGRPRSLGPCVEVDFGGYMPILIFPVSDVEKVSA